MAYSLNPALVVQRKHLLVDLAKGLPTSWRVSGGLEETRRVAYRIREALFIAARNPEKFPELARAYDSFSIHVVDDGLVEARPKSMPTVSYGAPEDTTPIHGVGEASFRAVRQVGLSTADELITAWNAHQPSSDPLLFQRTTLSVDELTKLWAWAQHPPKRMILVGEDHVTLSLYEAEVAAIAAWSPPSDPVPEESYDID